jgi:predicted nucleic-acid-binding Zn-ribbon protein
MTSLKCPHCGRNSIVSKTIEFREINMKNMSLTSSQKLIEQECMDCGHIEMVDPSCLATV